MKKEKYCKDCKFYIPDSLLTSYDKCSKTNKVVRKTNLVSGETEEIVKSPITFCDLHRDTSFLLDVLFGVCGRRGRWFEPKEE